MPTHVPALLHRLVDDAAVFPPGNAPLPEALRCHREHRDAWYAPLVGPLLLPASELAAATPLLAGSGSVTIGVVGDTGLAGLPGAVEAVPATGARLAQLEVAVAKRGEDPLPGLRRLIELATELAGEEIDLYAEVPLTWGLHNALDTLAQARGQGVRVAAKFRTGGLAAELFPTPVELAAVICACRDRALPFKLTAGLHHAIRHNDPETGFTHHGFLNVLVAALAADDGAEVADVAERLAGTDPVALIEEVRPHRESARPLWLGFGSCSVPEPLADLHQLRLLSSEEA
ncbi:MAG: hypothetical protein ACM30G_18075 [Micromonosporaceae bacterium]